MAGIYSRHRGYIWFYVWIHFVFQYIYVWVHFVFQYICLHIRIQFVVSLHVFMFTLNPPPNLWWSPRMGEIVHPTSTLVPFNNLAVLGVKQLHPPTSLLWESQNQIRTVCVFFVLCNWVFIGWSKSRYQPTVHGTEGRRCASSLQPHIQQ